VSAACPLFGFEVVIHLSEGLSDAASAALWDDFISGPIESRGLVCVGGIAAGRWSHVVHGEAGQATDADRQAVLAWAGSRPEIAAADVGPLADVTGLV
jgi:uncharacterized protein YggL (DUF469 family)